MKYDDKFEKYYKKIEEQYSNYLENKRKQAKRSKNIYVSLYLLLIIIGTIFIGIYKIKIINENRVIDNTPFFVLIIIVVAMFLKFLQLNNKNKEDYDNEFKNKIITSLLSSLSENIIYEPKKGIDSSVYEKANFGEFSSYESEDLISGQTNSCNYSLCEITVKNIDVVKNIEENYLNFNGLFAVVECPKKFRESVYIRDNKNIIIEKIDEFLSSKELKIEKIELESKKFEELFDVYSSNKIVAMQLLTSDVMEMLVDFRREKNIRYEVTIRDNYIYYKFLCGKLFETKDLNYYSLDKDMLYRYYRIVDFSLKLSEKLIELVKDTEY